MCLQAAECVCVHMDHIDGRQLPMKHIRTGFVLVLAIMCGNVLQRTKEEVWLQRMRNLLTSPLEQQ